MKIFSSLPLENLEFGIFDFDNGIVDTESVFAEFDRDLLNEVILSERQVPLLTADDVRPLAGHSGSEKLLLIAKRYNFDAEPYLSAFNDKRNRLRTNLFQHKPAPLAKGLNALFDHLGERRALATNKKAFKLTPDMKAMGIDHLFDVIVTTDELPKKPAPDVILKAIKELSANNTQCAYFGDNVSDIQAAIAANVTAVGFVIEGMEGNDARVQAMKDAGAHAVIDDYNDAIAFFRP